MSQGLVTLLHICRFILTLQLLETAPGAAIAVPTAPRANNAVASTYIAVPNANFTCMGRRVPGVISENTQLSV